MRAAFSADNLLRAERANMLGKVVMRSAAACLVIAVITAIVILKIHSYPSANLDSSIITTLALVGLFSVLLGGAISMAVYAASIVKFTKLLHQLSQEYPDWECLDSEYMGSDVRHYYLSVRKLHNIVSSEVRMATIGRISSHIAHDMRSPLSVLRTYVENSEMMKGRGDDALYDGALRSIGKLNRMADDLVDYAKASNLARVEHDVRAILCGEVLSETKRIAEAKGALIHCMSDQDIHANVDPYRLSRVVVNLVNNAVQAAPPGDGHVEIRASSTDDGSLVITVKDNGRGIDAETLPHIFESFFTKGKRSGTGLGLAYCKQVVEAHRGTVEVASEVGKGSTFTIRIPNCVIKSETEIEPKVEIGPQSYPDLSRVLIADDDPDMRLQWKRIIKQHGGSVAYEAATVHAVENNVIDYTQVDTAIVDYRFEGEDKTGIDLIAHLKRKGVKRVFLCTGFHDDPDVRQQACEAGAEGVIAKPLEYERVTDVLINSLSSERSL